MANLLGMRQATLLSKHYGGETIAIPRGARLQKAIRNRRIQRAYDLGVPASELAIAHRLTERQIYSILATAQ